MRYRKPGASERDVWLYRVGAHNASALCACRAALVWKPSGIARSSHSIVKSGRLLCAVLCSAVRCPTLPWPAAADWLTAADCLALQSTLQCWDLLFHYFIGYIFILLERPGGFQAVTFKFVRLGVSFQDLRAIPKRPLCKFLATSAWLFQNNLKWLCQI